MTAYVVWKEADKCHLALIELPPEVAALLLAEEELRRKEEKP